MMQQIMWRPTGVIIAYRQQTVYKLPWSWRGCKGLRKEAIALREATDDPFFAPLIPQVRCGTFHQRWERLKPLPSPQATQSLLLAWAQRPLLEDQPLQSLIADQSLIAFCRHFAPDISAALQQALQTPWPVQSQHGDFHSGNIMINKSGALQLIDWQFYRRQGPAWVDLIDFMTVADEQGSWTQKLFDAPLPWQHLAPPLMELPPHARAIYALWKCAKELSCLSYAGQKRKQAKYLPVLARALADLYT